MELPRDYISYSQVRLYQTCPRKYYYSYVKRLPTPLNDKIYLGIMFHAAVEYYLNEKIKGTSPVRDRVLEYFNTTFQKGTEKQEIIWKTPQKETLKRGQSFVRHFMKEIVPFIKPMMVEKELWAELPDIGVKLRGVIDLVEEDFSITDFKTTTAKWSKARIKSSYLQVVVYRYLFEKNFGDVITKLKFKILYSKNATTHIRHQEVAINPKDVDFDYNRMFEIFKYVVEGIRGEAFYKNESYSCGFCEYKDFCRNDSNMEPKDS